MKEAVLPFNRFPDVDTVLGPEMRSHRRGHGHRPHVRPGVRQEPDRGGRPAARARARSSCRWPTATRPAGVVAARRFVELGFSIAATAGTAALPRGATASRSTRSWPRSARHVGVDAVELHLVGQGRPGGQHAPGPGPARRRRPHPPGRHRPRRRLPHHGRRRPGRGGRHRRLGAAPRPTVRSLQEYHRDGQLRLEV